MSETITLQDIHNDLQFVKKKLGKIEQDISVIRDVEPEVREEYLEKLKKIEKEQGRVFDNKEEFLAHIENEI